MDEQDPIQLKHLFKRPVVRQWLYNGNYYREKDERQSSRFELFSDLLFVGVVHQLADGLAEEGAATALNVAKFVLVFYPAFSIWSDMRRQLNMSGTDDCFQRIYSFLRPMTYTLHLVTNNCSIAQRQSPKANTKLG